MATAYNSVGTIIRYKRKQMGLAGYQLAEKLGVASNSVYGWEKDRCSPNALDLCCLADFFGCTVDELLGRTELT